MEGENNGEPSSSSSVPPSYAELYPTISNVDNCNGSLSAFCQICDHKIEIGGVKCNKSTCPIIVHSNCFQQIRKFFLDVNPNNWKCKICMIPLSKDQKLEEQMRILEEQKEVLFKEKQHLEEVLSKMQSSLSIHKKRIGQLEDKVKKGKGQEIKKADYHQWVDYNPKDPLPTGTVQGGYDIDRTVIYVGRANFKNDLLPAKVLVDKDIAFVSYSYEEHAVPHYQILCMSNPKWVSDQRGQVPSNAVQGGYTSSGEILFIGRVNHADSLCVGKIHPSHGVCYIPFDGREINYNSYEVLVHGS